jgi:5-formyltetrahydrofolate cyclo-ligase
VCLYILISGEEVNKEAVRKKVWDYLEKNNIAQFPRPAHGRVPNFKGSPGAAQRLSELHIFKCASTVSVTPDKPQQAVRVLVLEVSVMVNGNAVNFTIFYK